MSLNVGATIELQGRNLAKTHMNERESTAVVQTVHKLLFTGTFPQEASGRNQHGFAILPAGSALVVAPVSLQPDPMDGKLWLTFDLVDFWILLDSAIWGEESDRKVTVEAIAVVLKPTSFPNSTVSIYLPNFAQIK